MASVFYFSPHILLVSVINSLLHHPFYRNEVEHNKAETHKNLSIQNRFQKRCVCSSLLWNSSVRVAFMVNLQSRLHHHALLKPPTSSSNNLALDVFSKIKSTLRKKKKKNLISTKVVPEAVTQATSTGTFQIFQGMAPSLWGRDIPTKSGASYCWLFHRPGFHLTLKAAIEASIIILCCCCCCCCC